MFSKRSISDQMIYYTHSVGAFRVIVGRVMLCVIGVCYECDFFPQSNPLSTKSRDKGF
jgi:hypothetical protein